MAAITKRALDREIMEYEDGKLDRTNARDLAALYTIRNNLFPVDTGIPATGISYAGPESVPEYGDTAFFQTIAGKDSAAAWNVMDQLMATLAAVHKPLYESVLRQLNNI